MMKNVLNVLNISLLFVAIGSFAGGWEGPAEIDTINVNGNGWELTAIKLVGVVHSEPGCTGNQAVAVIEYSHPGYESFLSLALAAKMAGKKIQLSVSGCESHGYPIIKEMALKE